MRCDIERICKIFWAFYNISVRQNEKSKYSPFLEYLNFQVVTKIGKLASYFNFGYFFILIHYFNVCQRQTDRDGDKHRHRLTTAIFNQIINLQLVFKSLKFLTYLYTGVRLRVG